MANFFIVNKNKNTVEDFVIGDLSEDTIVAGISKMMAMVKAGDEVQVYRKEPIGKFYPTAEMDAEEQEKSKSQTPAQSQAQSQPTTERGGRGRSSE